MWDSSQPGTYPKMASDLIRTATEVNIWYKCKEIDIRHLSDISYNSDDPNGELFEEYDLDTSLCDYQANLKEEYKKDMEEYKNDE